MSGVWGQIRKRCEWGALDGFEKSDREKRAQEKKFSIIVVEKRSSGGEGHGLGGGGKKIKKKRREISQLRFNRRRGKLKKKRGESTGPKVIGINYQTKKSK